MPQGQGGVVDGGSGVGNAGGLDAPSRSSVVPLDEEMYTPPMTRSHIEAGSSAFDATHFY